MNKHPKRSKIGPFSLTGLILWLTAAFLFFVAIGPSDMMTLANCRMIVITASIISIAALGAMLVMTAGGIDLSCWAAAGFCQAVFITLSNKFGFNLPVVIICCLAAATFAGIANGLIVLKTCASPAVATLGTMLVLTGASDLLLTPNGEKPILEPQSPQFSFNALGWFSILFSIVFLFLLLSLILEYTILGRQFVALGFDEEKAKTCGINVSALKVVSYTLGSLFAGIAGIMGILVPLPKMIDSQFGIIAIVGSALIGGCSFSGGYGTPMGVLIGALIMAVIQNGLWKMNLSRPFSVLIYGLIVLALLGFDRLRTRYAET